MDIPVTCGPCPQFTAGDEVHNACPAAPCIVLCDAKHEMMLQLSAPSKSKVSLVAHALCKVLQQTLKQVFAWATAAVSHRAIMDGSF